MAILLPYADGRRWLSRRLLFSAFHHSVNGCHELFVGMYPDTVLTDGTSLKDFISSVIFHFRGEKYTRGYLALSGSPPSNLSCKQDGVTECTFACSVRERRFVALASGHLFREPSKRILHSLCFLPAPPNRKERRKQATICFNLAIVARNTPTTLHPGIAIGTRKAAASDRIRHKESGCDVSEEPA